MKYGNEGLMAEGTFVKGIAEKTKAEDCEGKSVAGSERIAIEEAGKCLIVVFLAGNDVPECGVECYGKGRNVEGILGEVYQTSC